MNDLRMLVLNYKQYPQAFGEKGLEIARYAENVFFETGVKIVLAVPFTMIHRVASIVDIDVVSQHVDPFDYGAYTGHIIPRAVFDAGGKGSLVNHSEKHVTLHDAYHIISKLRNIGLYSIACASTPQIAAALSVMGADFVATEPPELIGTGISVSRAKPEVITNTVKLVHEEMGLNTPILVGAGVTSEEDSFKAVSLGANGVLVASAVMKAVDPYRKMVELASGIIKK